MLICQSAVSIRFQQKLKIGSKNVTNWINFSILFTNFFSTLFIIQVVSYFLSMFSRTFKFFGLHGFWTVNSIHLQKGWRLNINLLRFLLQFVKLENYSDKLPVKGLNLSISPGCVTSFTRLFDRDKTNKLSALISLNTCKYM